MIYSGPAHNELLDHFSNLGFVCPRGFNIADYLVDLTMHAIDTCKNDHENSDLDTHTHLSPINTNPTEPTPTSSRVNISQQQEDDLFTPRHVTENIEADFFASSIIPSSSSSSSSSSNSNHQSLQKFSPSYSLTNINADSITTNSINILNTGTSQRHFLQYF